MIVWLVVGVACVALIAAVFGAKKLRAPEPIMWQFGHFTNTRPGIRGHTVWEDEDEVVEYDDWRYWIRVKPNPGINVPLLGYWSRANGRKRR